MQNLVIACLPNHAASAVATITAGADAGGDMPAANLKTSEPWQVARLTSVVPHLSWWECAWPVAVSLQALALVNHTLIPGDQARVVGVGDGGSLPAVRSESLLPTAIVASVGTGFFGAVGDIDEDPATPDANLMGATLDAPWGVTLAFGDPAEDPAVGSGALAQNPYQAFVLRVEGVVGGEPDPNYQATVNAVLLDAGDGGFFRDLGTKTIPLGGAALIFPWPADDLPTSDGSGVQLQLNFTSSPDVYSRLNAIRFECLHASDLAAADFDTGWEAVAGAEPEAAWGGTALQEIDLPPTLWARLLDAPAEFTSLRVEFRADGLGYYTDSIATPPRTPNGFIDAGVLGAGPAFEVPYNFAPGASLTSRPQLIGDEDGLTGSNRAVAAFRKRAAEVEFVLLPEATAHSLFARLDMAAMGVTACLLILEPWSLDPVTGNATVARNTTFWAIVEEARGLVYGEGFEDDGEPLRSMGYRFVEKL